MITSINFNFLQEHDPIFLQLASSAERNFTTDPNTTLVKVRQLGEALAQDIATRVGVAFDDSTTQIELLKRLSYEGGMVWVVKRRKHFIYYEKLVMKQPINFIHTTEKHWMG